VQRLRVVLSWLTHRDLNRYTIGGAKKCLLLFVATCVLEADPSLTDENLLDEFVTFFVAGHETTANALSFLLCEVGRRPDVMQR